MLSIGQATFRPYPYQPGFVTKMIVHAVQDQPQTVVLTGNGAATGDRCGT